MNPPSPPNILWFQTDEQRPDSLGCYGSAWARTPHVDSIARQGVVFQNAVCNSPVCLPSRSSQLCARYPQEFGALNNMALTAGRFLEESFPTFPEVFARAGYATASFGRNHNLARQPFQVNQPTPDALPGICSVWGLPTPEAERAYHVIKRPGTHHRPLVLAGTYPGQVNPNQLSADRGMLFLEEAAVSDQPFLLRVSFNSPHTPTLCPPPFDQLYDPADLPIQWFDESAMRQRARHDRHYADLHRMQDLTALQVRQMWKDYMGLCAYVDHEVGRLLRTLERLGLRENTIILFSSDHGKALGEWGTGEKNVFDREVWRVPFVWSWPGKIPTGQQVTEPVELLDTGRTLLGLAGLAGAIPASWRGRELFREGGAPRDAVFGAVRTPIQDDPAIDPGRFRVGIRTRRHRMDVDWQLDGRQPAKDLDGNLFDCAADPHESQNLFSEHAAAAVREELLAKVAAWMQQAPAHPQLLDRRNAGILF